MITKFKADLGLLSVTVFWGSTFILSKLTLNEVPLSVFLFLRLTIAAIAINLYSVRHISDFNKKILMHGAILGVLLYLSYLFQMWGIQFTSASNAGFITGLSVVLVPVFGFFLFKYRLPISVLVAIILAVAGLLLLTGANPLHWSRGDLLVLVCSVAVAFHIILTGKFAPQNNVFLLTGVQLATVSLLTFVALFFSDYRWPELNVANISVLIYLGLFGTVYTFLMQTAMQRYTTTARTALIFSMEPVFAAVFAFYIAGERLSALGWAGGLLIVTGMVVAEIPWKTIFNKTSREQADLEVN